MQKYYETIILYLNTNIGVHCKLYISNKWAHDKERDPRTVLWCIIISYTSQIKPHSNKYLFRRKPENGNNNKEQSVNFCVFYFYHLLLLEHIISDSINVCNLKRPPWKLSITEKIQIYIRRSMVYIKVVQ